MKAVQVKYTVKPEYVEQNRSNIRKVMERLRSQPIPGMYYSSHILDDGQTFVHINICKDEETMSKLGAVEEFAVFRKELKASGPLVPPSSTKLNPVAAGFEL